MSDYDFRPGGALKLKGGVVDGGVVKKKRKKSKSKDKGEESSKDAEKERVRELEVLMREEESKVGSPSGSSRASPALVSNDRKTAAEKRFEEVRRQRLADKVARLATQTHKDRVAEFNAKLEALSEHHDIPKVGPG